MIMNTVAPHPSHHHQASNFSPSSPQLWTASVEKHVDKHLRNVLFALSVPVSPRVDQLWTTLGLVTRGGPPDVDTSPRLGDGSHSDDNNPQNRTVQTPTYAQIFPMPDVVIQEAFGGPSTVSPTPTTMTTSINPPFPHTTFERRSVDNSRTVRPTPSKGVTS